MPAIPAGARILLDFVYAAETDREGDARFLTIIGHNEARLNKPLTAFTVDELLLAQKGWPKRFGVTSGAAGAPQIIRKTLLGLKQSLGLRGSERFTPALQDRLAYALLKARGYERVVRGAMTVEAFALELAREWASMPVLAAVKGGSRRVARGQSYYAGDGANAARVSAEALEAVLAEAFGSGATAPEPRPAKRPAKPAAPAIETVLHVQARLKELGYSEVGAVDGRLGSMTAAAILAFRNDNGLPLSPAIDEALQLALASASPRAIGVERTVATPAEVRAQVPEVKTNWLAKLWAGVAAGFAGVVGFGDGVLKQVGGARDLVQPVFDFASDVPVWVYCVVIGAAAAWLFVQSRKGEAKGVEAFQNGERR